MRERVRPGNDRPEPAVGRAVTCEPQLGTEVALSGEAEGAAATGNGGIEHDALAGAGTARHDAGELVAEDERPVENRVADAALEEPVTIGPAETDAADAHEHLSRLRLRVRFLVQPKLARRVQAQSLHAR
jgi:hypothetical protein